MGSETRVQLQSRSRGVAFVVVVVHDDVVEPWPATFSGVRRCT
jgi:hypothetical protein